CLEAGLYYNLFGCGALIMRSTLLSSDGLEVSRLLDARRCWAALSELIRRGARCDTIPEPLATLPLDSSALATGDSVYGDHMEVLASYTRTLPDWVSRVLVHAVGAEHRIEALHGRIFAIEKEKEL